MIDYSIAQLKWPIFTLEGFQLHSAQVYHLQLIKMFVVISMKKKKLGIFPWLEIQVHCFLYGKIRYDLGFLSQESLRITHILFLWAFLILC